MSAPFYDTRYKSVSREVSEALRRYADENIETGGFLRAVLENDLRAACLRADSINRDALAHIVLYCENEIPSVCWGSEDRVTAWLMQRDLRVPK